MLFLRARRSVAILLCRYLCIPPGIVVGYGSTMRTPAGCRYLGCHAPVQASGASNDCRGRRIRRPSSERPWTWAWGFVWRWSDQTMVLCGEVVLGTGETGGEFRVLARQARPAPPLLFPSAFLQPGSQKGRPGKTAMRPRATGRIGLSRGAEDVLPLGAVLRFGSREGATVPTISQSSPVFVASGNANRKREAPQERGAQAG